MRKRLLEIAVFLQYDQSQVVFAKPVGGIKWLARSFHKHKHKHEFGSGEYNMKRKYLLLSASIIAIGYPFAAPALTQEAAQEPGRSDRQTRTLEVITVTAQRRQEDIQDVPISVTAITGELILESGVNDMTDLSFLVPNFQINPGGQVVAPRVGIRGVNSVSNQGIEPSVGIFVDGAYVPRPGAIMNNLFDVQQVEVLRGPQGTLFGRNTPIGAINILTNRPEDVFGGSLTAELANFGSGGVEGHLTGPLAENLSGRVGFSYRKQGAYLENTFDNEDELEREDFGIRGRLLWDITDTIEADLVMDHQRLEHSGASQEFLTGTVPQVFKDRVLALYGEEIDDSDTFDRKINHSHSDAGTVDQTGVTLTFNVGLGEHTLTSISAYREFEEETGVEEIMRMPIDFLPREGELSFENMSQEFRIASPTGQTFEYIAGLFLYDEEFGNITSFNLGDDYCNIFLGSIGQEENVARCNANPLQAQVENFSQELTSTAVFGQATYNATEALSFTGGLRWTRDEKEGVYERVINNIAIQRVASPPEPIQALETSGEAVDWLASARYFINDDMMLFATASTGFKSGGFNSNANSQDRVFDEETSETYEVGVKSTLFNGLVTANGTLFRTDVNDFQERSFDGMSFEVRNAGAVRLQGVEVDVRASPIEQLDIILGVSYLDSEFTDFRGAPGLIAGPVQDLTGERRTESPEWTSSLAVTWTDDIPGTQLEWFVRGEHQFVDEQLFQVNNDPRSRQGAYNITNFRVGLNNPNSNWKVTAFVRNAFDEGYCTRIQNQVLAGLFGGVDRAENTTVMRCIVGRPRTYGIEAGLTF
ncbi:hypothetical protein CWI75_05340 [Kineobactrum sediminis]|uniref:TonB-dependent receptor n=1 Tax=Kineobactrum sediminis TaxID=1905677 RepID=A0A2N5Y387_9GAMM|nr:TonB-dependent receptor [Kineobactrum sediminis]PLW82874.1 hypothetical protein CWI75_05340 [Kineobactrum sediminis]